LGLIDGDSSQYRPVGLGIDVVKEGYLEKKRKEYLGELWVSLDPVREAYLIGPICISRRRGWRQREPVENE